MLTEHAWDEAERVTLTRHLVVEPGAGAVRVYGERVYAYTLDDYRSVLAGAGFVDIEIHDGFGSTTQPGTIVITARKPGE